MVDGRDGICCRPIPFSQRPQPQSQYLDLVVDMEVVLLNHSPVDAQYVGLGIIFKYPSKDTWKEFRIPHNFYVLMRLISVFLEFMHHASYYEF